MLQQEYSVLYSGEAVGKAFIQRQGLYYQISCRCALADPGRYRLIADSGENTADLGLCIPHRDGFGVDTKIPVKRLGEAHLTFRLLPKHSMEEGRFIPLSQDEPFGYIRQLEKAHLAWQDGLVGIMLMEDQKSKKSPTGQWSEPSTSE